MILLRTFSKFYGLASLRIAYALSSRNIVNDLLRFRIPPNHSRIAEAAARVSIEDSDFQERVRKSIREERSYLYKELERIGAEYVPTQTNFLLVRAGGTGTERAIRKFAENHLLIKNGSEFGFSGWLRVSIGNREMNQKFISILEDILHAGR